MSLIENRLLEITNILRKCNTTDAGLFTGNSGIGLFLAHVNQHYMEDVLMDEAGRAFRKSFDALEQGGPLHSFAEGYAGVCWALNHLVQQNLVEADINSLFEEIDPYLISAAENDLEHTYLDYLHGGLGAAIYFIDRLAEAAAFKHISTCIDFLFQQAVVSGNEIRWHSLIQNGEPGKITEFNLGLSHGIPGIICFLSKCYTKQIQAERCLFLINGAVSWILKQKLPAGSVSKFPSSMDGSGHFRHSRLGWCYGDLGIAACIWQAAKALNNESWKMEAVEIMLHASRRKELLENGIRDAGICHGTAGIAHLFNRFYLETGMSIFKETSNHWIRESLKMPLHDGGLAGYQSFYAESGWVNEYGLLNGVAGIGLVLLSQITEKAPSWDSCLLLS